MRRFLDVLILFLVDARFPRWETTNLMISYSTPLELIEQLKGKIAQYIDDNSREWSGFALNIDKMEYQNAIHLVVAIERKHTPSLFELRLTFVRRRSR